MTNQNIYAQGNQIVVLPDSTLVDVFAALFKGAGIQPNPNQVFMAVIRSRDGGLHWSAPVKIAPLGTALLTDPDNPNPSSLDETVRAGDYLPDIAVDHITGAIYVVWADGQGTNVNSVVLSKSTDGGQHWSTPVAIDQTPGPHAFNGTVEVAGDGTVAVLYYDFRNNTPAPGLPTDVWLTHSTDGGATWTEQHVTRPFDMKQAPVARGFCLGGTLSFLCGTQDLGLDGVIGFYAGMTRNMSGQGTLLDQAPRIGLPALGLFGGADQGIPPEQVAEFDRRLDGAGVEHEIISYPGAPHSFFDRRAAEFAEASADAWTRVLRFIRARAERAKER